jgi:hypothetical protein
MRLLQLRMTKFNGRIDRLEGKTDKQNRKIYEQGQKLDLIITHLGIGEH